MAAQETSYNIKTSAVFRSSRTNIFRLLTQKTGQAPTTAQMTAMSPQVAGQNVLSQAAQQQAATQAGLGALTFDPTTGAVTGAGKEQVLQDINLSYNKLNNIQDQEHINNLCLHINKMLLIQLYLNMIDKDKFNNKE
jgi:hypothetical protein